MPGTAASRCSSLESGGRLKQQTKNSSNAMIAGEKPLFLEKKAADNCFLGKSSPKKEDDKIPTTDEKNR